MFIPCLKNVYENYSYKSTGCYGGTSDAWGFSRDCKKYSFDLQKCYDVEISYDSNPVCESFPNPDSYSIRFNEFHIKMVCNWKTYKINSWWFDTKYHGNAEVKVS